MTPLNATLDAEIMVSAVISRTELPAFAVAALEPGDVLETEPEVGNQTGCTAHNRNHHYRTRFDHQGRGPIDRHHHRY